MTKNKSIKTHAEVAHRGVHSALKTLVHLIAAVQFIYAIYYDFSFVHAENIPELRHKFGSSFGGKFKYLTFINAIIQAFYYTICLVNDIFGTNEIIVKKNLPLIRRFKDCLLASLAFPVAMNVGIIFWTLMAIDRELVFPKVLDVIFPSWLNHIMHTNIVVFIILEMFISFRVYPKHKDGLKILAIFMGFYIIWIHIIRYYGGVWVYPILDVLDFPIRILFFLAILIFTFFMYLLGNFMNNIIWTKELKGINSKSK